MTSLFVDAHYWVAFINPKDQWHDMAVKCGIAVAPRPWVTTESVLIEVLNYFGEYGEKFRLRSAQMIQMVVHSAKLEVIEQNRDSFLAGIELYKARPDKGYSLTDCISMNLMQERGITEILTHDHHFTQEGFTILL